MKHLTLIPSANQVYIDRVNMLVDLSAMDPAIHAVQWSETYQCGEIEFVNDPYAPQDQYKPNQRIESREPYQAYVDAWQVAKQRNDAEQEELRRKIEEMANAPTATS